MEQTISFVLFAVGLAMIIKGSDWFIDSVIWTAKVFRIPYIIIGATIVSVCTTMPETFVSLTASFKGETDVAFGNALGSIALNTGVILGILLVFAKPVIENPTAFRRNGAFLMGVLAFGLASGILAGGITRISGLTLVLLLGMFLYTNYRQARRLMRGIDSYDIEETLNPADTQEVAEGAVVDRDEGDIDISRKVILRKIFHFVIGISAVIIGSGLLVDNGIAIAEFLGVPSILIAITFTALGTSLPELVTTITAIRKKASNLGVGNVIGANILNMVQVIGFSALVEPIPLDQDKTLLTFQFPATMLIVGVALAFGIFAKKGYRRWHGILILALYAVFLAFNLLRENTPILGPLFF